MVFLQAFQDEGIKIYFLGGKMLNECFAFKLLNQLLFIILFLAINGVKQPYVVVLSTDYMHPGCLLKIPFFIPGKGFNQLKQVV